jgi:hypothetical protein
MNLSKEDIQLLIQILESTPTGNLKSARSVIDLQEKLRKILVDTNKKDNII